MLKVKLINEKTPLKIKMVAKFPNVVLANLQDKETTPTKETQVVVADKTYDGLSKVTVNPIPNEYIIPSGEIEFAQNGTYDVTDKASAKVNVPEKVLGTKTITSNGTYKATDDNLDGYSEVNVETSGVDINDYLSDTITSGSSTLGGWAKTLLKFREPLTVQGTSARNMFTYCPFTTIPQIDTSNITNASNMFNHCTNITTIPSLNTSKVTNISYMFQHCDSLITIPQLDTSKVADFSFMFDYCGKLESVPELDTSSAKNMRSMFANCSSLTTIPLFNTSKVDSIAYMFEKCSNLVSIPQLDTSNVTSMNNMFINCTNLTTIPQLNGEKLTNIYYAFYKCNSLENFDGLINLGQAYSTSQSANYAYYKLDLSSSTKLNEQSLINVLNNLYDIKTKGVKPQQLILGATNLSKLTSEELAIATEKGWNVS